MHDQLCEHPKFLFVPYGGANFLYADGHVQFVNQGLHPKTAILLIAFSEGQVIPNY
jgi:prepilin-type processing-associated H-X9-DG protein